MIAADLFDDSKRRSYAAKPEMDALTDGGALLEAALVGIRVDVEEGYLGLLFDLRVALQLRMGNTAILVARGVSRLIWTRWHQQPGRIWHAVTGSDPDSHGGVFALSLGFAPDAELRLEACTAEFYVGDVPRLDDAPPNFVEDDDRTIRAGMPDWTAEFEPVAATFWDRGRRA